MKSIKTPKRNDDMAYRVFYISGPGDIIESHRWWRQGRHNPTEVSITFSAQIADFCRDVAAKALFVSTHPRAELLIDDDFILEHRPKMRASGLWHHYHELKYGLGLLKTALSFRANIVLVDSGTTYYFLLTLFRWCGIRVVPILHNTLWPSGFFPTKPSHRVILRLDRWFWKRIPDAVIAVSPECERQVAHIARKPSYPIKQVRAQFLREYFAQIPPPPPHDQQPFRVLFIGRIDRCKGVFDILDIAKSLEMTHPGLVRWEICGRGRDYEEFRSRHRALALEGIVEIRGWTSLSDLVDIYTKCHATIVPTRSTFSEGLAMTAAEAVLAGRPVITNPVVPALEVLSGACMRANTNDPESHRDAVLALAREPSLYESLRRACSIYQEQFYDRQKGLTFALKEIFVSKENPIYR